MRVEWHGQSAFALRGDDVTVAIDPFGDMSLLTERRGWTWDYPAIEGLEAHGVAAADATRIGHTPPVSVLFAAFLGYNPIQHLVGPHVLGALSGHDRAALAGRSFFPHLISGPFQSGLHAAFTFAILACLIAAGASLLRGGRYHHAEEGERDTAARPLAAVEGQHAG